MRFSVDPYICLFKVKQTVLPPWNIYVMIYNTYNDAIYPYPLILLQKREIEQTVFISGALCRLAGSDQQISNTPELNNKPEYQVLGRMACVCIHARVLFILISFCCLGNQKQRTYCLDTLQLAMKPVVHLQHESKSIQQCIIFSISFFFAERYFTVQTNIVMATRLTHLFSI